MADDDQIPEGYTPFSTSTTDPSGDTRTLTGYGPRASIQPPGGGMSMPDLGPGISSAFQNLPVDQAAKAVEAAVRYQAQRGYQRDLQSGMNAAQAFAKWGPMLFHQATGIPEAINRSVPPPITPQQLIQNRMAQQKFEQSQSIAKARADEVARKAALDEKKLKSSTESATKKPELADAYKELDELRKVSLTLPTPERSKNQKEKDRWFEVQHQMLDVRKRINKINSPESAPAPAESPASPVTPNPAAPAPTPTVTTKAQYDALKSGDVYVGKGGIPIDEPSKDEFGGVAVDSAVTIPKQEPIPTSGLERAARDWQMGGLARAPHGKPMSPLDQSVLGISPEMVPSGAGTRVPWLTIPLSVAGKTAAGALGYATSPQGAGEIALADSPAAPVIFAKWAYDMLRSGYKNVKAIKDELGQMANEALSRGIISANQLGPVPEGVSVQDHIQSLSEKAVNAALMGAGGVGALSHLRLPSKALPEAPVPPTESGLKPDLEKGVPSDTPGAPQPSAVPVDVTKEAPVTAGATPQAMAESGTVKPQAQEVSVTPQVTDNPIGMGGAEASEIPETGAGGEKYGVAERIRAERAQAGQVESVKPGKGMSTEETIALGRDIIRRDPEAGIRIMDQFESDPKKAISTEGIAVVRAHGESLAAGARTIEDNYGTESPEYKAAREYLSDWDKRTKAMQTEWHKQGQAQQGETDIDTGSYTGLERARQQATGQKIPEAQKPKAKKIASDNKNAQQAVDRVGEQINARIRQKTAPDAEKAAIAAAHKTVREAEIRLAEAENKARVAKSAEEKKAAESERKAAEKAKTVADRKVREAAINAAKEENRRRADPSIPVWELAKKYLDENKGLYAFDDLRNKIATDLKMKPSQVAYWMQKDPLTKRLADELWNKQRNARRLKEQAKIWLRELDTPGYQKALATIPRAMFSLSVFGHGFVALGTHAPIVAFQPRFWNAYVRNFGKMYKMVFSPAYYEMQMQDLVRRPNYEVARRSGLQNDPFKYEEFHTGEIKNLVKDWIGEKNMDRIDKFASAGNRGYGVLKLLRQDMFDQRWNKLPKSIRNQEGVAEGISDGINHATGVTKKAAPQGSNILLFAPRLAGSRVMWLGGDPIRAVKAVANWKNTTEAERQFAVSQMREKGWVFGTFASLLALNQGFLSATGSKQKINGIPEFMGGAGFDPLAGDFMKFKAAGANVAYGGALLTMAKLPVRVATAILYEGKGSKYILEDERVDKVVGAYIRSQMSPFAGTVMDLATGRDYEERPLPAKMFGTVEQTGAVPKRLKALGVDEPYNWAEFTATKLPIPVAEGIKEGLRGSGMSDDQINQWLKAFAVTSFMTGTGTRITEDTREE